MQYQLPAAAAALTTALAVLGACATSKSGSGASSDAATGTPAQQQALARYLQYAGPPIDSFNWLGSFYSWEPLSKDQLVVNTTTNDAYLLKVWPSCDLRFVVGGIGLSSTASTVYAHGDSVIIKSPSGPQRCPIDEIRRIDYQRMRADQRQQNAPASQPAPANQAAPVNPSAPPTQAAPPNPQ